MTRQRFTIPFTIMFTIFGLIAVFVAVLLISNDDNRADAADPFTVWAVGDLCDDDNTPIPDCAAVGDLIDAGLPDYFLPLGDIQYENGALAKFQTFYDPKVGVKLNDVTHPVPGNHEYSGANNVGAGYYTYFGAKAGDPAKGYYSWTVGNWKLIALNSNCNKIAAGCGYTLAQATWLRDRLAEPETCELVFNHHPPITDGKYAPGIANQKAGFWRRAVEGKADLFLSGHDHNYQRFPPMNLNFVPTTGGVRPIVIGTGGKTFYPFKATNRSEYRQANNHGALKLTLTDTGYAGEYVNVDGLVMDTFTGTCVT